MLAEASLFLQTGQSALGTLNCPSPTVQEWAFYHLKDIGSCFLPGQEPSALGKCWLSIKGSVSLGDREARVCWFLSVPKAGICPRVRGKGVLLWKEKRGIAIFWRQAGPSLFALSKGQRHLRRGKGRSGNFSSPRSSREVQRQASCVSSVYRHTQSKYLHTLKKKKLFTHICRVLFKYKLYDTLLWFILRISQISYYVYIIIMYNVVYNYIMYNIVICKQRIKDKCYVII